MVHTHAGVFVAGMDAGRAYNDFPYMAGQWVPDEYWAIRGWRGFFENTAAVQLHHRLLAGTTLISVLTTWAMFRGRHLPRASHHLLHGLAAMTAVQVSTEGSVHPARLLGIPCESLIYFQRWCCASFEALELEALCVSMHLSSMWALNCNFRLRTLN